MKWRGFLINYNGPPKEIFNLFPDNGLALLASVLTAEGYQVKILDYLTPGTFKKFSSPQVTEILKDFHRQSKVILSTPDYSYITSLYNKLNSAYRQIQEEIAQEIFQEINKFLPQFIGFKLWEGFGIEGSLYIARRIKEVYPKIITIGGGPQVDAFREDILMVAPQFDFLIYGEGELPLLSLLSALRHPHPSLNSIPNLIYREGDKIISNSQGELISLSDLPSPIYNCEVYPAIEEKKIKIFLVEESRGCPNKCNFCIHPAKSGNYHRKKKPEKILEEIHKITHQFKTPIFRLAGSNPPAKLLTELAQKIKEKNYIYSAFGHINLPNIFPLLKQSGCISLAFGVESGSAFILEKLINKHTTPLQIKSTLIRSREAGIFTIASVIVPTPLDTEETIKETLNLLLETKPDSVTTQFAILIPQTLWWEKAEEFGFKFSNKKLLKRKLLFYKEDFLLPNQFIKHIPYRIGKLNHNKIIDIALNFNLELEKSGIATGISDFLVLCAYAYGYDPVKFRNLTDEIINNRNYDDMINLVKEINKKITLLYEAL